MRSPGFVSAYNKKYHAANRDEINARHKRNRKARKTSADRDTWLRKKLVADARLRAERKGIDFAITINDFCVSRRCPIFNIILVWHSGKRDGDSPSLDRIDSTRGYVPGNIWVICWRANQIKSDATADELRLIADAIDRRAGINPTDFPDDLRVQQFPEALIAAE